MKDALGDALGGLAPSGDRFRQLVESSPDGMVIVDSAGQIVQVNLEAEALFGYSRRELLGQPVEILLPEAVRQVHSRHRAEYMTHPQRRPMGEGLELAGRHKDGQEFPVDISLTPLPSEDGTLAVAHVRDISERRRSERDLLLSQLVRVREEERLRVAADLHDDTIQAIAAAGVRLDLLRGAISEPEQVKLLDRLEKTLQVAVARMRTLMLDLHPPTLDRDGLADTILTYLEHLRAEEGILGKVEVNLRAEPTVVTRGLIYRLLQESLSNVRKHSGAKTITVRLKSSDEGYWACMEDDGVGFDVEDVSGRPTLGLAAMRELAEMAHGWLKLESRPGEGTRVEFWIPDEQPSFGKAELASPPASEVSLEREIARDSF